MTRSPLKFFFFLFSAILLLGSCSDPKEEAISYFEEVHYTIYMPVDAVVAEQNNAIGDFMTKMKNRESIDIPTEIKRIDKMRLNSIDYLSKAFKKASKVTDIGDKSNLKQEAVDYMQEIMVFQTELGPVLDGLKDGLNPKGIVAFSNQLAKGKGLQAASEKYNNALREFKDEFDITELDLIKIQASH